MTSCEQLDPALPEASSLIYTVMTVKKFFFKNLLLLKCVSLHNVSVKEKNNRKCHGIHTGKYDVTYIVSIYIFIKFQFDIFGHVYFILLNFIATQSVFNFRSVLGAPEGLRLLNASLQLKS